MVAETVVENLAAAAAQVATVCDHSEHVEAWSDAAVTSAASALCRAAFDLAAERGIDLFEAYANRLETVEDTSVLPKPSDPSAAARTASTWRNLQVAQADHDRIFHPDVNGLSRLDQLRHYAFHLAKFPDAVLRGDAAELDGRRLPDMLLFAIKMWTLARVRLPEVSIEDSPPPIT
jgi:hypothetical protein